MSGARSPGREDGGAPGARAVGTSPYEELLADLAEESDELIAILDPLPDEAFDTPTPAAGWAVRDQVGHLAYFDDMAVQAMSDPPGFVTAAAALVARGEDFAKEMALDVRSRTPDDLRAWFEASRATLVDRLRAADPKERIAWFGPDMSVMSSATARLMETWAHGVDIRDCLGVPLVATDRLRHVAHLGVRTFGFSFAVRGEPVPSDPVRVELAAPGDHHWAFGPTDAADVVSGTALDFCLVVTQRRHLSDTSLASSGATAAAWLARAQAFAGPPGPGRQPRAGSPGAP